MSESSWGRVVVRGLSFDIDGSVVVEYCIPDTDARENGVLLNHALYVPDDPDYSEGIHTIRTAVVALVEDVLEDMPHLEPLREAPTGEAGASDDDNDEEVSDD